MEKKPANIRIPRWLVAAALVALTLTMLAVMVAGSVFYLMMSTL